MTSIDDSSYQSTLPIENSLDQSGIQYCRLECSNPPIASVSSSFCLQVDASGQYAHTKRTSHDKIRACFGLVYFRCKTLLVKTSSPDWLQIILDQSKRLCRHFRLVQTGTRDNLDQSCRASPLIFCSPGFTIGFLFSI